MIKNSLVDIHNYVRQAKRMSAENCDKDHGVVKHKEYRRMKSIILPTVSQSTELIGLTQTRERELERAPAAVALEEVSELFGSLRIQKDGFRNYPSYGESHPIEVYVVGTIGGLKNEVFHYSPQQHTLDHLWSLGNVYTINEFFVTTIKEQTAAVIIFTAVWERTSIKYGELGYQLALLEAGHMGQSVLLAAARLGVGARPFIGYNDEMINDVLDLDPGQEQPVYSIQIFA